MTNDPIRFQGIMATPVTPFGTDGKVDKAGIASVVSFLHLHGIKSIYCLGTYGGFALMQEDERKQAAEFWIEACKACGMRLILNISATSTREAVSLARHAERYGADAISSLVPFYYSGGGYRDENYYGYFQELLDAAGLPVYFYNNPRTTGYRIDIPFLGRLLDSGLHGMKEGTGDLAFWLKVWDLVSEKGKHFDLIPGQVNTMLIGRLYGARCVMSGPSVYWPEINLALLDAFDAGEFPQAVDLHRKIMRASRLQGKYATKYEGCYALLTARGVHAGQPRPPWRTMDEADLLKLKSEMATLGMPLARS